MNINLDPRDRILILGPSFSGKTFLAKRLLSKANRVVVFSPHIDEWKEYPNRVFGWNDKQLFDLALKCIREGNVRLAVDDADIPMDRFADDDRLRYLLAGSRHRNVGWVCIARRASSLPPLFFENANQLFLFNTQYPNDLKLYRASYGVDADVRTLRKTEHGCVYLNADTMEKQLVVAQ